MQQTRRTSDKPSSTIDGIIRPTAGQPPKIRLSRRKFRIIFIGIGIVVITALTLLISFYQNKSDPNNSIAALKNSIGKHYVLPTDEEPAVATVTDTSKLSSAFQNRSANGDRILIYQKTQQAIVYRPSIDRIVAVVPVQIDTPQNGAPTQ